MGKERYIHLVRKEKERVINEWIDVTNDISSNITGDDYIKMIDKYHNKTKRLNLILNKAEYLYKIEREKNDT
jgi:hypothetical protein